VKGSPQRVASAERADAQYIDQRRFAKSMKGRKTDTITIGRKDVGSFRTVSTGVVNALAKQLDAQVVTLPARGLHAPPAARNSTINLAKAP
jgi:hypothetical protein